VETAGSCTFIWDTFFHALFTFYNTTIKDFLHTVDLAGAKIFLVAILT
jgi:hypothetical protein